MPTNDNYTLDMGANLTPTWGPLATQIEQAIELAVPNSYRGMVIADTATPTTTGAPAGYPAGWYEWQKRCLWLNTANNQLYGFDGTTWALVKAQPLNNTVNTASIVDGAVTISKLSPTGGTAYQIPRINSGATALVWANATDLFNANEIAISKLGDTSVGSFVLTRNGPTKAWTPFDSATLLAIFGTNEIPVDYLTRGSALQVPMVNAGGTATVWSSVVSGIADGALSLAKLAPVVADAGKYLRRNPTTGVVESVTLTIPTNTQPTVYTSSLVAVGAPNVTVSFTHGLTAIPDIVEAYLVCRVADIGYAPGARIKVSSVTSANGFSSDDQAVAFTVAVDATNVKVTEYNGWTLYAANGTTGGRDNLTITSWDLLVKAVKFN